MKVLVFFLLLVASGQAAVDPVSTALSLFGISQSFVSMAIGSASDSASHNEILEQFGRLADRIDQVETALTGNLHQLQVALPAIIRYEERLNQLFDSTRPIHALYKTMQDYKTHKDDIDDHTLVDFAESTVSHSHASVKLLVDQIHQMVRPKMTGQLGILSHALNLVKSDQHGCNLKTSQQYIVDSILKFILVTQVKGLVLMEFSWIMLQSFGKGNFQTEALLAKNSFESMLREELDVGNAAISSAASDFWKCDPGTFVENESYVDLKRVFQGFVAQEEYLNDRYSCKKTCPYYSGITNSIYCDGTVRECQRFKYISYLDVCYSSDPYRRYDFLTDVLSWTQMGKKRSEPCRSNKRNRGYFAGFFRCDLCFCICDDDGEKTQRYFDLRLVKADINSNRIVTGVRLKKTNKIVHLEIQTGEALPLGAVDQATVKWEERSWNQPASSQIFRMDWNKRAVNLDELKVAEGRVLTGVQLQVDKGHLGLKILSHAIDVKTGFIARSSGAGGTSTTVGRRKISLDSPDIPTRSPSPSLPLSADNQYIEFTHSDIDKDVAQTTVPYIDIQPVAPSPSTWIGGAGLYYKGTPGYGGFLGIKLWTLPFSSYIGLPEA